MAVRFGVGLNSPPAVRARERRHREYTKNYYSNDCADPVKFRCRRYSPEERNEIRSRSRKVRIDDTRINLIQTDFARSKIAAGVFY